VFRSRESREDGIVKLEDNVPRRSSVRAALAHDGGLIDYEDVTVVVDP
jgi:hypothetical protein